MSVVLVLDEFAQNITDCVPQGELLDNAARDHIRQRLLRNVRADPNLIDIHVLGLVANHIRTELRLVITVAPLATVPPLAKAHE